VLFPFTEVVTPQNEIWIKISSSNELETGEYGDYAIWSAGRKAGDTFYFYYLHIRNLKDSSDQIKVKILDRFGNEILKSLNITYEGDVLGTLDVRDEKVLPSGDDLFVVLDKDYALPSTYEPSDLVEISEFEIPAIGEGHKLRGFVIGDLKAMLDEARTKGHKIYVLSAYRSYATQLNLYKDMSYNIPVEYLDSWVAKPGHSEHQLGTAIDVTCSEVLNRESMDFASSKASEWLRENAYKYGFVMSYPKRQESLSGYIYEPWHYRYVGIETASRIYESHKLPTEYLKDLYSNSN
jgi:D-alanyl-D-alanine carboxypeptidase